MLSIGKPLIPFPPTLRLLSNPGPCLSRYPLLRPPLSH
ncbi:hypothetical protein JMJ77_0002061, partial [Colletotrichum scovillei]